MKGTKVMGLVSLLLISCLLLAPAHAMIDPIDAHYSITEVSKEERRGTPVDIGSPTMQPISIDDVFKIPEGYEEHVELRDEPYIPETEAAVYYVYQPSLTYKDVVVEKHPVLVECADWELYELYCLAYLEAGSYTQSDDCIRAVVEAVFNQLNNGSWGNSLHEVIYSTGNYEPASNIPGTVPSQRCIDIVNDVYNNGISLPSRIMFFRAWYYHQWYGSIPEFEIDGVYFNSSIWHQD